MMRPPRPPLLRLLIPILLLRPLSTFLQVLGQDSPSFRDFGWTFITILLMSIGELPDFEMEFWRRDNAFGFIFFWLVNMLSMLFLMNVFLSIVIDGYMAAVEASPSHEGILATGSKAFQRVKRIGPDGIDLDAHAHRHRRKSNLKTQPDRHENDADELKELRRALGGIIRDVKLNLSSVAKARRAAYKLALKITDDETDEATATAESLAPTKEGVIPAWSTNVQEMKVGSSDRPPPFEQANPMHQTQLATRTSVQSVESFAMSDVATEDEDDGNAGNDSRPVL